MGLDDSEVPVLQNLLACVALFLSALSALAQEDASPLISLDTQQATKGWEAVGRLDVRDGGFCTAALIRDRLLLTAAHCVYDQNDEPIPASEFTFQAGLRYGRADATRNIIRVVPHPDYVPDGPSAQIEGIANDIAVLELAQPIRYSGVEPFPISSRPRRGDSVAIVSYGQNREEAPSLQESCSILHRVNGALVMNCDVIFGASGAPVFRMEAGRARIVSVVSASANSGDQKISFGTSLEEPLQILLAEFAALGPAKPGGEQRLMRFGERNDTGAKFIRP